MPRKTKKEKRLAEIKRLSNTHPSGSQLNSTSLPSSVTHNTATYSFTPTTPRTGNNITNNQDNIEFTAIRHDLIKTISIALIALVVELGLYWKFGSN